MARNLEEDVLAGVWMNILGLDEVGMEDNYFEMGGDSIRSIRIAALAKERGLNISVAQIHNHPTIRGLAETLKSESLEWEEGISTSPFCMILEEDRNKIPEDIEDAYPLNMLQEGMIFHRDFAAKSAVYHAIISLRLKAFFNIDIFQRAVQRLVNRHPLLRTSFDLKTFNQPLQLVHKTFNNPLHYDDLRGLPSKQQDAVVASWVEQEKKRGFEEEEFPLIRFQVHQLTDDTFQFAHSYHHEIVDGWSDAILITELFRDYFSDLGGRPIRIDPPSSTFADSIALERKALNNERFKAFWTKKLEGVNLMRLPRFSIPKADKGDREIIKLPVPISKELSDAAKQLARELAVPLKSVMVAVHMKVMSMMSGQPDTLSYTVSNGRPEHAGGDGIVGLFVNSLSFRMMLQGGTWSDLIKETLKTEQESIRYRRYPMAEVKRHQGFEPLAETLFFFTNYHIFEELEKRTDVKVLQTILYGESTFPFCANCRLDAFTSNLELKLEYDSLQFSRKMMVDIAGYYVEVLKAVVDNPLGAL